MQDNASYPEIDVTTPGNCGIVLITSPSEQEAASLAHTLVEEQLAACVNILSIQSVYRWKEEICKEPEWQLVIKTNLALFETLTARVVELHPYDVPEIIALPIIQGYSPYLHWIQEETHSL